MSMVCGAAIDPVWDAGEIASAVYEDRFDNKRTNGRVCETNETSRLADCFTRFSTGISGALLPAASMGQSLIRSMPSPGITAPAL